MDARARFLIWFGLPVLSAGLGAGVALFTGAVEGLGFGDIHMTPLVAVGLYLVVAALVAVVVRMRQGQVALGDGERFDKPVEAALVAMCAPVIIVGLWAFGANLVDDFGGVRKVSGKIVEVEAIGGLQRAYAFHLDSGAEPLFLECYGRPNCGQATPLLRLPKGAQADLYLRGEDVVGITVDGKNVLKPFGQRAWRMLVDGMLLVLMILYTTAFAYAAASLLWPAPEDDEVDEGEFITIERRGE